MSDEEYPMTMQVGMVGTDGVLIASDTKWMNELGYIDPSENQEILRHTFNASKIIVHRARGLAISSARKMAAAEYVANKIISDLKSENWDYPCDWINKIGAAVLRSKTLPKDAQCLIVFALPIPRLYFFGFGPVKGKWGPICKKMDSTIAAGDNINAALFWEERYYRRQPIKNLVPLAAHLIVSASKLNNGSISGLEIVLCDASGFHRIDKDSIHKLEAQANEWDEQIGSLFTNYNQDFGFDPNEAG